MWRRGTPIVTFASPHLAVGVRRPRPRPRCDGPDAHRHVAAWRPVGTRNQLVRYVCDGGAAPSRLVVVSDLQSNPVRLTNDGRRHTIEVTVPDRSRADKRVHVRRHRDVADHDHHERAMNRRRVVGRDRAWRQPRPRARDARGLRAHRAGARPVRLDERRVGLRPQGAAVRPVRRRGRDAGRDPMGAGPAPSRSPGNEVPGHHDR